jgi:hypothetical protein
MNERREPSIEEITHLAYALYLQRGCEHGKDVDDWVAAERELTDELVVGQAKTRAAQANRQAVTVI